MIFDDNYDEQEETEDNITIDVDSLRKDLLDDCYGAYFGGGFGAALVESFDVEKMSAEELVEYAISKGVDIRRYQV